MKSIQRIFVLFLLLTLSQVTWASKEVSAGGSGVSETAQTDPDANQDKKKTNEESAEDEEEPDCE